MNTSAKLKEPYRPRATNIRHIPVQTILIYQPQPAYVERVDEANRITFQIRRRHGQLVTPSPVDAYDLRSEFMLATTPNETRRFLERFGAFASSGTHRQSNNAIETFAFEDFSGWQALVAQSRTEGAKALLSARRLRGFPLSLPNFRWGQKEISSYEGVPEMQFISESKTVCDAIVATL